MGPINKALEQVARIDREVSAKIRSEPVISLKAYKNIKEKRKNLVSFILDSGKKGTA